MPVRLILIGPPGVGKGTQAALLRERLGAVPVSSGDIFRAEISQCTDLGTLAKGFIDRGELVPDEVTVGMMRKRLLQADVQQNGFVLDGFPRTVMQAIALQVMLEELGERIDRVVALEVPDEVVVRRLAGRRICPQNGEVYHIDTKPPKVEGICDTCHVALVIRPDDNEGTIRNRLEVFHAQTIPVVTHFAECGALLVVDGNQDPETVYGQIVEGIVP